MKQGWVMMKKICFKDYGLEIDVDGFINIIGSRNSGKTYLLKMMINQKNSNNVFIDDKAVSDYDIDFLRNNVAAVLNNFIFNTDSVREEMEYYQKLIGYDNKKISSNITKFVTFFGLKDIIDTKIGELTREEKAYVKILSLLVINPAILGIDDMLTYLKVENKLKIVKYAKSNKICILNVTSDSEELLFGKKIVILDNFRAIVNDDTLNVLSNDKILSKIGMNMPFIAELSSNLNYYDLLKEKFFDINSLVGELWK